VVRNQKGGKFRKKREGDRGRMTEEFGGSIWKIEMREVHREKKKNRTK